MHALCTCQSAQSICFHQHGFENHISLVLDSCHAEFDMNIHKAGMLRFATIDLQLEKQQSSRSEQRNGTPLRKRTNKDDFRCLITIWCIGIA